MIPLHTLFHLTRADFLERTRRYSFLVTLGLTIFAAYLYIPPSSANYLTMGLGNYRAKVKDEGLLNVSQERVILFHL